MSFGGLRPLDPHQRRCPWTPPGALKRVQGPWTPRHDGRALRSLRFASISFFFSQQPSGISDHLQTTVQQYNVIIPLAWKAVGGFCESPFLLCVCMCIYVPVWLGFRYLGLLWKVEVWLQPTPPNSSWLRWLPQMSWNQLVNLDEPYVIWYDLIFFPTYVSSLTIL